MIAIGLMCGTSLDGIDAVRVAIHPRARGYAVETLAFTTLPFEAALRARILAAYPPAALPALALSALHDDVGEAFGVAALAAGAPDADFVASHGLTLAHDGDAHHTLQIGDPFRIREATGKTVIADFRSADTAAGGTGAPLVPYVDALLLAHAREARVALNLGGIANLTVLRPGAAPGDVLAFDCGPANLPADTYVELRTDGAARSTYVSIGRFAGPQSNAITSPGAAPGRSTVRFAMPPRFSATRVSRASPSSSASTYGTSGAPWPPAAVSALRKS